MRNKILCLAAILLSVIQFTYPQPDSVLIFLSDTQAPIWVEKIFLRSHQNEKATQRIYSSILNEKNVCAVIHAGDVTSYGFFRSAWKPILPFIDSLKRRSIPFIAAKGNHDYYFYTPWAMEHFEEYVPNGKSEYTRHRFGAIFIFVLNSNFEELADTILQKQKKWYSAMLDSCEADSSIRSVITVAHHSPYTNSDMVTGSDVMRNEYLPAFYRSSKSRLWVGGHAHRFEHFVKNGKDFVVIGGGGGLHHGKKTVDAEEDTYAADGRFFHYLRCTLRSRSLLLEVQRITTEQSLPETVYRIDISPEQ